MPKVRILANTTDEKGNVLAAGQEVDVSEEDFARLRSQGSASSIDDEKAAEKAAAEGGNFSSRMTRGQAGEATAEESPKATPPPAPEKKK
jgi:hypothetical protein